MLLVRAISAILAAVPFAIALPEQPTNVNVTGKPTHYAMLVFPGFQPLDVYGPLDVIAGLPMAGVNQPLHLSILSRTLEPVSSIAPPHATNMSHGNFGHSIVPTARFKDVLEKPCPDKGEIDVLFVPGGIGTRADVAEEIAFVKEMFPRVKHVLSVCTGATILARSGILDGKNATTNKRSWAWATSTGPNVDWVASARWVDAGKIWTSSGVSAGIDLTFAWVEHMYGKAVADYVALNMEYVRWQGGPSNDPFAKIWELPGATR